MGVSEILLAETDYERYGIPRPLLFDHDEFSDLPWSVSGAWESELEAATRLGISEHIGRLLRDLGNSKRALAWLACKMAKVDVPDFADFDIKWRRVRVRDVPASNGDADPPQGGSSEPSSE